ncbi:MAG: YdiU family protein [Gammaproteobacteria bacterium]|nr:YdiU family protein [Gammaproteobacteria bacterium]
MNIVFENTYARLPSRFYVRQAPVAVTAPGLVKLNHSLAVELGLEPDLLSSPSGLAVLAGNSVPDGAEPLAMAYAGHQFGGFVPQLGDGRAILLGEVLDPRGERFDIQLKGSGQTPFSRAGDGRAWLGPVLREYIVSESMHGLGIPTTRSLAAVSTGEPVYRESELPGAVLTRVARSHVRIGTFEYFFAREDAEALRHLADYVIDRHYPESRLDENPCLALLRSVIARQAHLVAQWLGVGFIHGVMNTDNMSIAGETIDYGPCAFMDTYHPGTVYSSIDRNGRYAFGNQPPIAQWNLSRLAQSLLPLIDEDPDRAVDKAQAAIDDFPGIFEQARLDCFRAKLGLGKAHSGDAELVDALLRTMADASADFTNTFRALCDAAEGLNDGFCTELGNSAAASDWLGRWRERIDHEAIQPADRATQMRRVNPVVIPRNHRVAAALDTAVSGDLDPFEELLQILASPWGERPHSSVYRLPPEPHEVVHQTFCGT